jgi:hypothetical protein
VNWGELLRKFKLSRVANYKQKISAIEPGTVPGTNCGNRQKQKNLSQKQYLAE